MNKTRNIFVFLVFALASVILLASPNVNILPEFTGSSIASIEEAHTGPVDDTLPYPITTSGNDPNSSPDKHPMFLKTPPNLTSGYEYDPESNQYVLKNRVGNMELPGSSYMTLEEYLQYDLQKSIDDYWQTRAQQSSGSRSGLISPLTVNNEAFKKIFGSGTIDIRPQGSAELIFGIQSSKREDPQLNVKQQRVTNFDFQEKIKMNVRAKVGDKIDFGINYDTEANFEFDNKMKLAYEGTEDEMLQLVEAGDISFPLQGNLITGSQKLFGLKTEWKFGKLKVATVFSQQKSESKNITVEGGALIEEYYVKADEYEENKHFFLAQYFRDNYNKALEQLPAVNSGVNISRIEVWVTSIGPAVDQNRNIVALMDLGEQNPYRTDVISALPGQDADNGANNLYQNLVGASSSSRDINQVSNYLVSGYQFSSGLEFEKVENARKLNPNEYTFNSKLGFISLNTRLNPDQVLAVAYEYTVVGSNDIFQVGEFSTDGITAPDNLFVKLLKSTSVNTKVPTWDLMMKNVYSTGAWQISPEDFRLDLIYEDPELGVRVGYLREGAIANQPLIRALGMDRLNAMLDLTPDGVFDYIDNAATIGGTVQASRGRIYFPVLEPFGEDLRKAIDPGNPNSPLARKYAFDSLYTLTKHEARQYPNKNRFAIEGQYKSSTGSEISLQAMNVPQGSVKVTAGGVPLREGTDYTVDYTLGRVKIINEGILSSGTPINISLESNNLFNVQTKTLLGTHLDYEFNEDMRIGGTIMNLTEKPLTPKVTMGDEPISNTIWGLDGSYLKESRLLTKWIDALPLIETKAPSMISVTGEFAHFIPGHPRALGKTGISYIDDFEGSSSGIDMMSFGQWSLASVPRGQGAVHMFPEGNLDTNILAYGYNRARFNWYVIDPLFTRNNNLTPDHIKNDKDQQSNHYVRQVWEQEVFPNKENGNNIPTPLGILNLSFYPDEKGPYNYDVEGEPGISAGIDANGKLLDPSSRWGGMMRQINQTDFEATNIEYIEFWLMDPFIDPDGSGPDQGLQNGGELYFNLGDISEDILKDGRKAYENGMPVDGDKSLVDSTIWGYVPQLQALTNSFDNNPDTRPFQDIGYDGLTDAEEQDYFQDYLARINALYPGSVAYNEALQDPSNDNYHHFRGTDYDDNTVSILERYKLFNETQGNTPTSQQNPESYSTSATNYPDIEDINGDNTLSEEERYFQYRVQIRPNKMNIGENYITDVFETNVQLENNTNATVKWYQFRIPITDPDKVIGQIKNFNSIRFMRVFMKDFDEEAHLRFATLDLVRNEWRKYTNSLLGPGEYVPNDDFSTTTFEVSEVNIEANGSRDPIPYVLPSDIEREIDYGTYTLAKMNEASMTLRFCELQDGDARAVYKTADFDFRRYKNLEMYVHAEESYASKPLYDDDVTLFIRLGTDFTENFYEYEIPLKLTPWGSDDPDDIWPDANKIQLTLQDLIDVKQARNIIIRENPTSGISISTPYKVKSGSANITVIGTPTLSSVKTIMIGIRNPRASSTNLSDDGLSKCGEVWVNELRVTDFENKGGWAANTVIAADLADLGNVTIAGNISTAGFGSLEQTISERQDENIYGYDFATNLELGKLFDEKAGMRIPVHFDYSETFKDPEYNPLNPDVLFKDDIATYSSKEERDSVKKISQDYTRRTSFNMMNVKKMHTGAKGKNRLYDIENFDVSYRYQSEYYRNIDIEYDSRVKHYGALGYNYQTRPKPVEPFKKVRFLRNKWFALIRDFNFYYLPKQLRFTTDVSRNYSEAKMRNKSQSLILLEPTYIKTFDWNRNYVFRYDLAKSLKFDYNAIVMSRIDEPAGIVDRNDAATYNVWRTEVLKSARNLGSPTNFNQQFNLNYTVPLNKVPILNWINANAGYSGKYTWNTAPRAIEEVGNTIENSAGIKGNATANFVSLYNKVDYLKKLNKKSRGGGQARGARLNLPANESKEDSLQKKNWGKIILDKSLRVMMMVRNANISYNQSDGTLLPGFLPKPNALGNDWNLNAPGMDFIMGRQVDIAGRATDPNNPWLTDSELLNIPTVVKTSQNLTGRISIEPVNRMRLEISFRRNYSSITNEYYQFDTVSGTFQSYNRSEMGQFSMTYSTWRTAFVKDDEKTQSNANFENFKAYLPIIAERLAQNNQYWVSMGLGHIVDSLGRTMPDGYTSTQQDVMLYAFLAAYSGQDPEKMDLRHDPVFPKPNWRLTYNGLTDIPFIKKYFKTFSLSHAYQSTYNINGYTSNLKWESWNNSQDDIDYIRDELNQSRFVPKYDINLVSINEQFSPLLNLDMTLQNSFIVKVAIRKSRNLSLSMANNQLSEVKSQELIIGTGYRFKQIPLKLKLGGNTRSFESDINLKLDFSIRENKTVLRKLVENVDQISQGQRVLSINFSADYQLSQRITFRAFYDQVINNPFVSSQFPNSNTNAGISLLFSLAQ